MLAGLALADVLPDEPSLSDALLVCATELTTDDEIARFASGLAAELAVHDHTAPTIPTPGGEPVEAAR